MKLAFVLVSLALGVSLSFYYLLFNSFVESPAKTAESFKSSKCAPHKGVVVANMIGRLGNNLFEIGMANRLAADLCWEVVYRPFWSSTVPSKQSRECFPNALRPENVSNWLKKKLHVDNSIWEDLTLQFDEEFEFEDEANERLEAWVKTLEKEGLAWHCKHEECDFTGNSTDALVEDIREGKSKIRVLYLEAFFIHFDWMSQWREPMRQWLTPSPSCCYNNPPENAVVIHVRDFVDEEKSGGIKSGAYLDILEHYNLMKRPVWIVCQPKSIERPLVQELVKNISNAKVVPGKDPYDAFCIMQRASTLVVAGSSSYSQIAAILAPSDADVHYPTYTLDKPPVTLSVPEWKYHLISESKDKIEEFDIKDHDRLVVNMG